MLDLTDRDFYKQLLGAQPYRGMRPVRQQAIRVSKPNGSPRRAAALVWGLLVCTILSSTPSRGASFSVIVLPPSTLVSGWVPLDGFTRVAVSPTGEVVVGSACETIPLPPTGPYACNAWRWQQGTLTWLASPTGYGSATAVGTSVDGSVVVGNARVADDLQALHTQAVRWVNGVPTVLPSFGNYARALDVSADGQVVVGTSDDAAVRWDSTSLVALETPPGKTGCGASSVSANGQRSVGVCAGGSGEAFLWAPLTPLKLPIQTTNDNFAHAIAPDGLQAVGYDFNGGVSLVSALLWKTITPIAPAQTLPIGLPTAISNPIDANSGRVVTGFCKPSPSSPINPCIHRLGGTETLQEIVAGSGLTSTTFLSWNWHSTVISDISADGTVLVGYVDGENLAFRAVIPKKYALKKEDFVATACSPLPCDLLIPNPIGGTLTADVIETRRDHREQWRALRIDLESAPFLLALEQSPVWRLHADRRLREGATLTLHYDDATLDRGVNEAALAIFQRDPEGGWAMTEVLQHDAKANTIKIAVDQLSDFVLAVPDTRG